MQSLAAFLQSVYRNPVRAGSIAPSSSALSKRMASFVPQDGSPVVELGAGTGAFTSAILDRGVAPDRMWVVELDPSLAQYLRNEFPAVNVLCGNAADLPRLLPAELHGSVGAIISGVPMRNLSRERRRETMAAALQVLRPGGDFLQFTYGLRRPIETKGLPLQARRMGRVWTNLPPAAVWCYRKDGRKSSR